MSPLSLPDLASQTTGYMLADIVCGDLGLLFGPRTDGASVRLMLENIEKGKPGHKMVHLLSSL
jgi:hypothetical protein